MKTGSPRNRHGKQEKIAKRLEVIKNFSSKKRVNISQTVAQLNAC
jgi:hypothetical protein